MTKNSSSLKFVAVTTPSGRTKMTLAPFGVDSPPTEKYKCGSLQKKRKTEDISSSSSSSEVSSAPPSSPSEGSWLKNLERRGGFWGDANWYDLQLEKRLPLAKPMLKELVLALPPCGHKTVLDMCSGSGRVSTAVLEAYPTANLVLVDSNEDRLVLAGERLEQVQEGAPDKAAFFVKKLATKDTALCEFQVDAVVACLAFHVLVERPAHYTQEGQAHPDESLSVEDKYEHFFKAAWTTLCPGGHLVFGDHVGQLPLFKQLKLLEKAGFIDVDCAWRQDDCFVAGGRKPKA